MNDENSRPIEIAIMVVNTYKAIVLIPNLESGTSSDKDKMPHTIEKNIKGIIISLRAEINKSETKLKTFIIIKSDVRVSVINKFRVIPIATPKIIATMIFFVNDMFIL